MSRWSIREEPIDSVGVQETIARQDEQLPPVRCRENVFRKAREILQRLDRAAYSRSE
jgi:hypothetical protein